MSPNTPMPAAAALAALGEPPSDLETLSGSSTPPPPRRPKQAREQVLAVAAHAWLAV